MLTSLLGMKSINGYWDRSYQIWKGGGSRKEDFIYSWGTVISEMVSMTKGDVSFLTFIFEREYEVLDFGQPHWKDFGDVTNRNWNNVIDKIWDKVIDKILENLIDKLEICLRSKPYRDGVAFGLQLWSNEHHWSLFGLSRSGSKDKRSICFDNDPMIAFVVLQPDCVCIVFQHANGVW